MSKYTLPGLPYDYGDLEPAISGDIMEIHHKKHHQAYVNKLNEALDKYGSLELADQIALLQAIKFNGGGHVNHSIFWTNLAPVGKGGGEMVEGNLKKEIDKTFGSLESMIEKFNAKTAVVQGSGWGWLGYCKERSMLCIETCANQDPLSTKGLVPLLGIDVWEHAYYLQYKNARPEYLKNIWKVVNWKNVEERYNSI